MYYKKNRAILYRDYGDFGYITDNRNFGYKTADDDGSVLGDKVLSQSGSVFFSVLDYEPLSIDELVKKICKRYSNVDAAEIKEDAIEFYSMLEKDGFVTSGKCIAECNRDQLSFSYNSNSHKHNASAKRPDADTTQDFFDTYFHGRPQLLSIHTEIIGKCNERCLHCYIPHEKKTEIMTPDMFYDILEQARKMNVLHLTISGGEPMAHPAFLYFIKKCNEYNFSVNVLSNLTLLSKEILQEMKNNPLLCVQTSLYSMDPEVHDTITQNKGSFERTKAAILEIVENDIPLQISCPILKQNLSSYKDVVSWGRKLNVNVNSDFVIIGQYDHRLHNLSCRLSTDDLSNIIMDMAADDPRYMENLEKEWNKKKELRSDDYICSVCHTSLCISETGMVYPCPGWQNYVIADISTSTLEDIWNNSERVNYLRNLRRKDFPKCMTCQEKEFCTMCMVRNANESSTGDPLEVNPYFCAIAKLNKDIFQKKSRQMLADC